MGFWNKQPVADTTEMIHFGQRTFPLQCDTELYQHHIEAIKEQFRIWIASELVINESLRRDLNNHLMQTLRDLNVKMLAHDEYRDRLQILLDDTAISSSGTRFMDTILYIYMTTPQVVMDTITGRFLGGVLYYLPTTINGISLPTKQQWLQLMTQHVWVTLLPIYQNAYDSDDIMKKIRLVLDRSQKTQTVVRPQRTLDPMRSVSTEPRT